MSTRLLVWGNNNENLLSPAPNQCLTRPEEIVINREVWKIAATEKHVSFLTLDGGLYSYGRNLDGRVGNAGRDN